MPATPGNTAGEVVIDPADGAATVIGRMMVTGRDGRAWTFTGRYDANGKPLYMSETPAAAPPPTTQPVQTATPVPVEQQAPPSSISLGGERIFLRDGYNPNVRRALGL